MNLLDWIILIIYIIFVTVLSYLIGRRQKNQEDYYLGGRGIPAWRVGSSLMANQVSAISLIGAPAFIALKKGGGLIWLQYEMAIPLAMIVVLVFLVPVFRKYAGITIYEYLEKRFGTATRSLLGLVFLISRSMATGVALLTTALVTSVCIGWENNLPATIVLIGVVSLVYTALGGIEADIISDVIQLAILWISSFICIAVLLDLLGGKPGGLVFDASRLKVFELDATGLGDGKTFSFWPMLFGGLFLYISYYGCDQSQAQRLLATRGSKEARQALVINGIFRFPLVLTYCVIGLLLIPFLVKYPDFAQLLQGKKPDYLMPLFFIHYIPTGILGIIVAGIFAASMSSLDSAINSLSASTWEDFLVKFFPSLREVPERRQVFFSRGITIVWGIITCLFALSMAGGAETVLELVNKIGSAFYGPIAAVFAIGIISRKVGQRAVIAGLVSGFCVNVVLWLFFEKEVSWMWWNLIGFFTTFCISQARLFLPGDGTDRMLSRLVQYWNESPKRYSAILLGWFMLLLVFCICFEYVLRKL